MSIDIPPQLGGNGFLHIDDPKLIVVLGYSLFFTPTFVAIIVGGVRQLREGFFSDPLDYLLAVFALLTLIFLVRVEYLLIRNYIRRRRKLEADTHPIDVSC